MEDEEVRGDDEGVRVYEEVKGGSAACVCVCLEAEKD